jgi:hypothetical protein
MIRFNQKTKDLPWKPYRKKPVWVRAVRIGEPFEVETLEGVMRGKRGDFLIEGVDGELYPCDAGIFFKTYEEVKIG